MQIYNMLVHSDGLRHRAAFYPITQEARDWCLSGGLGVLTDGVMIIDGERQLAEAMASMPDHFVTMTS